MVYNAIWCASSSYPYIYSYQVSMKTAKALPRYGSGHKRTCSKKHFFKIQRAITLFLTDGVRFHLACIILLCICIYTQSSKFALVRQQKTSCLYNSFNKTSSNFIFNICKRSFEPLKSTAAYVLTHCAHVLGNQPIIGLLRIKRMVLWFPDYYYVKSIRDTESNDRTVVIQVRRWGMRIWGNCDWRICQLAFCRITWHLIAYIFSGGSGLLSLSHGYMGYISANFLPKLYVYIYNCDLIEIRVWN